MSTKKSRKPTKKLSAATKTKGSALVAPAEDEQKIRESIDKLFSYLGNLTEQEPADHKIKFGKRGTKARKKSAVIENSPPLVIPKDTEEKIKLDALNNRIQELEKKLQEKGKAAPKLYDKEQVGYAFKGDSLEPLTGPNLGKSIEDKKGIQAPLTDTGQTIGTIHIEASPERPWEPEEESLLSSVAQQASLQIQSLRLLASAERARTEAEEATRRFMHENWASYLDGIQQNERLGYAYDQASVTPFLDKLTSDEDLSAIIKVMEEEIGTLSLKPDPSRPYTDEDKKMVAAVASQIAQQVENIRLLADASRARAEAEDATRRLTRESWQEFTDRREKDSLGFTYDTVQVSPLGNSTLPENIALTVPLEVRGETIGQLVVAGDDRLAEDAIELARSIAAQANTHIENLRLLEETELGRQQLNKRAAELETVAKVSTAAAAIRDSESLLRSVVDLTNYSFKLYHTSIYLFHEDDDGTKTLNLFAASGKIGQKMLQQGHTVKLGKARAIITEAARTNEIVIISDTENHPLYHKHPLLPNTRSEMAIPMIVADQLVGVFDVKADIPNRFTEDDKRTYSTLASQTAVALQNAQLYEEQIKTVERLRELDQLKSSFLANMSHELRTPLNSISGFTQVMLEGIDGPLTKEMEDDLGLIDKNAEHLLRLINEVLDMAKIEAGNIMVVLGPANLHNMLDEVIKTTSGLARENDLTISLVNNIPEDLIVMADDLRIQQVMINLIGNAMKFTKKGGVTIRSDIHKDNIIIKVIDTGIGIPPDQLESIFQAFSQVDISTTRKAGGTGLGLPISKRFIEMHNGRLWAESTGLPGEGSAFILEIPVVLPED
ncbi:MAG: GAF domain-containing protein [Anaerolineales bacterium]|uniref:Circadian input-output histidine kinase CikA n=1 Tax=Candidatus Desulfolinea nitratireducens TaxID=2841698 RepID=A0A8J6NKG1_9CHLR|nr:GAF domain-containing protein [Candidatus Desulfolinea nitratireducens]MBL6959852.1 GAF domain-containing protein [Anaerolineales bacterium]